MSSAYAISGPTHRFIHRRVPCFCRQRRSIELCVKIMDQFATNSEPDLGILKLSVWDFDDNFDDYELYGGRYLSWLRWRCR